MKNNSMNPKKKSPKQESAEEIKAEIEKIHKERLEAEEAEQQRIYAENKARIEETESALKSIPPLVKIDLEEVKQLALKLYAEFRSISEIRKIIKERFSEYCIYYDMVSLEGLVCSPDNRYTVSTYRRSYLNRLKGFAIAHRTRRIEDLDILREMYWKEIKNNPLENRSDTMELRYMTKGLTDILAAARDEIEGRGVTVNLFASDMDSKSDDELIARRDELLKKAERSLLPASQVKTVDITDGGIG